MSRKRFCKRLKSQKRKPIMIEMTRDVVSGNFKVKSFKCTNFRSWGKFKAFLFQSSEQEDVYLSLYVISDAFYMRRLLHKWNHFNAWETVQTVVIKDRNHVCFRRFHQWDHRHHHSLLHVQRSFSTLDFFRFDSSWRLAVLTKFTVCDLWAWPWRTVADRRVWKLSWFKHDAGWCKTNQLGWLVLRKQLSTFATKTNNLINFNFRNNNWKLLRWCQERVQRCDHNHRNRINIRRLWSSIFPHSWHCLSWQQHQEVKDSSSLQHPPIHSIASTSGRFKHGIIFPEVLRCTQFTSDDKEQRSSMDWRMVGWIYHIRRRHFLLSSCYGNVPESLASRCHA